MIGPKTAKPTAAQERDAYGIATDRDENTCQRCHRRCGPQTRDHRQNRQRSNTVASNLQVLGGSGTTGCHGWKTAHPAKAIAEGWAVPGWAVPSEFPARRYVRTPRGTMRPAWVLYDNAGSWEEISDDRARELGRGLIP